MKKQNRNTWLFLAFLLLAGLSNMIGRMLPAAGDALISCIRYVIYTGLLIFWLEAVRIRLLPSRSRTYMYTAACFMLLYMFLRFFSYQFAVTTEALRYARYAYWIPQMLASAFFLMVCIRIRRGEMEPRMQKEALLLIPTALLSLMAMTNDLHWLVYVPHIPLDRFYIQSGTYSYHFGFYLLYGWMILTVLAGIILLFRAAGRMPRKTVLLFAADIFLWFGLLLFNVLYLYPYSDIRIFDMPETNVFGMIGIFEISIRGRLIPYNENYIGFFSKLKLPVLITDRKFRPVYASAANVDAEQEDFTASLREPVYPEAYQKLSGKEIRAGYAFWVEDETEVHQVQERLSEANEMIEQENALLAAETKQKEENARIKAGHRIYHEIAEELYPVQQHIAGLLTEMTPGTEDFRGNIAQVSVLNAYVKRKANLLLLASEKERLSNLELYLALEESAGYLTYRNLLVSVEAPEEQSWPAGDLIFLYDAFEQIAEQLIGNTQALMVSFHTNGLRLAAKTEQKPDCSEIVLPVRFLERDDILYMDIFARKEGASK